MKRGVYPTVEPMLGRRYGHLTVLAIGGEHRSPGGQSFVRVVVRCDCGAEPYETLAHHVRYGNTQRCSRCRDRRTAAISRTKLSVRLANGWTLGQVALVADLKIDTVYHRWLRGWPDERLGDPVQQRRSNRCIGGGTYLPERRRTMIPAGTP